ncbi:MAG: O-antigen ligase family protein [Coriobacteriales bacterium]|nr:O-antigen ligase family protein [Coriobacteriales bacterium]
MLVGALPLLVAPGLPAAAEPIRIGAVAAVTILAIASQPPKARIRTAVASALLALFLVLCASAAVFSGGAASSVFGVHGRFAGLVMVLGVWGAAVAGVVSVSGQARWLVRSLAVTAGIEALVIVFQTLNGLAPTGSFVNADPAGAWLALAAAASCAGAVSTRGIERRLLVAASAAAAAACVATGSRGAMLALLMGALVPFVFVRSSKTRAVGAALLLSAVGLGLLLSGPSLLGKFTPAALSGGSAASRVQIWRASASMISERPLLGVGPGRYVYAFPRHQPAEHARLEPGDVRADQAHSAALQTAAEAGTPAAFVAIALFVFAAYSALSAARRRDAAGLVALAVLAAYGVQGLFGVSSAATDVLGWTAAGMALARMDALPGSRLRVPAKALWLHVERAGRVMVGLASVTALVAVLLYISGDSSYSRGLAHFEQGEFAEAWSHYSEAVERNPLTDTYRVAQADAALYMSPDVKTIALRSVDEGLQLEPGSYDLALSRARLLASLGVPAPTVARAYERARDLYPLGVAIRAEADAADRAAQGSDDTATSSTLSLKGGPSATTGQR